MAIGSALLAGCSWGADEASAAADSTGSASAGSESASGSATYGPVRNFVSTDLTMPALTATTSGTTADGKIFTTAAHPKAPCGMILDDNGEPYWIRDSKVIGQDVDTNENVYNLRAETYDGKPVLQWVEGRTGNRKAYVVGPDYEPIRVISKLQDGHGIDVHEMQFTGDGSVLLVSQVSKQMDLTSVGGPKKGWILDGHVYEVDLATGDVTRRWVASDDIAVTESYRPIDEAGQGDGTSESSPYDPYHLNSAQVWGDSILVSCRATCALYSVERSTGKLEWRMHGKRSDFQVASDAAFSWQHHARWRSDTEMTLFDNNAEVSKDKGPSSAKYLTVDLAARTVALKRKLERDEIVGFATGSTALVDDHTLVSFGTGDRITEFDADDKPVLDLSGFGMYAYRAFKADWIGIPTTSPDVAARRNSSTMTVYASWNGATEVAEWEVLTGTDKDSMHQVATMRRSGFESSRSVPTAAYVAVRARDVAGTVLGTSKTVTPD